MKSMARLGRASQDRARIIGNLAMVSGKDYPPCGVTMFQSASAKSITERECDEDGGREKRRKETEKRNKVEMMQWGRAMMCAATKQVVTVVSSSDKAGHRTSRRDKLGGPSV